MKYSLQRVKIVSYLFILVGVASWIQFGITYASDRVLIPAVEMILLPAGLGMLRHSEAWRKISIAVATLGILVVILVPILGYTISPVMNVRIFGTTLDANSTLAIVFVFGYATLLLASLIWISIALCNKEVREAFSE